MPKRRQPAGKSDSDSEFEVGDDPYKELKDEAKEDDASNNEIDRGDEVSHDSSKKTVSEPVAISKRQKKRKRKTFDETVDEEVPSHLRKTAKGGYAHTNRSKSRISKANAGNTPWNKGKNRSSADRAKIAAGVRARNRAILLEKLKRLGITEEEYLRKKKEIKYLRERIRRAKLANANHTAALAEKKLKAALQATNDKVIARQRVASAIFSFLRLKLIFSLGPCR